MKINIPLLKILTFALSHNTNHFVIVNINDTESKLCTRCLGMIFGLLSALPFILILSISNLDGYVIAGIAVLLVSCDLIYWGMTRTKHLPDYNYVRVGTGYLLGIGITIGGQVALSWELKIAVPLLFFVSMIVADRFVGKPSTFQATN